MLTNSLTASPNIPSWQVPDLAFTTHVASHEYNISASKLLTVNSSYVKGQEVETGEELHAVRDLTSEVKEEIEKMTDEEGRVQR